MFEMNHSRWKKLISGENCPFCKPRLDNNQFWDKIATLSTSTLYLNKKQTYLGYSLLIFDGFHANSPSEITQDEWIKFSQDLYVAQKAIEKVVNPTHMNVAALGNQISHLHYHIIPRYDTDPRWGAPIWMNTPEEMAQLDTFLDESTRNQLIENIQKALNT
jgi:ATP adenylyltransferase